MSEEFVTVIPATSRLIWMMIDLTVSNAGKPPKNYFFIMQSFRTVLTHIGSVGQATISHLKQLFPLSLVKLA